MDKTWLDASWQVLLLRGGVALVFGVFALAWPISTALTLALVWGFWALGDGIGSLVQATRPGPASMRLGSLAMGVIALVAAFFALFSPAVTAVTLTWFLGIWLILRGVFEVATSFSDSRPAPRGLMLLSAAFDFLLGVLFVANPGAGAVSLAIVLGITALAWGAAFVAAGLAVRRHGGALASGPPMPSPPAPA